MTINNYQGRVSPSSSPFDSLAVPPPIYKVVHTGTRPLSVVYVGNMFMGESMAAAPIFEMQPSGNCHGSSATSSTVGPRRTRLSIFGPNWYQRTDCKKRRLPSITSAS